MAESGSEKEFCGKRPAVGRTAGEGGLRRSRLWPGNGQENVRKKDVESEKGVIQLPWVSGWETC